MLGALISIVLSGFLIGGLARLALPGPDPMPFSLTVLLGLSGSLIGGGIAAAAFGAGHTFDASGHAFVTLLLEIGAAVALLSVYRRYVQRRPSSGPARTSSHPEVSASSGCATRLRRFGVDPDKLTSRPGGGSGHRGPRRPTSRPPSSRSSAISTSRAC